MSRGDSARDHRPADQLRAADAVPDRLRRRLSRRPGRGGVAARALRLLAQLVLTFLTLAAALVTHGVELGYRRARADRRGVGGGRRPDALHVGAPAGLLRALVPAVRRPHGGERPQCLRTAGRRRTRHAPRSRRRSGPGVEHTEVFPLGAVRAVRDDGVRRVLGPDHHVRGAGDLVPAALPAVRAGPAPAAAQSGGRSQVLPARRACPRRSSSTGWRCSTATRPPSISG